MSNATQPIIKLHYYKTNLGLFLRNMWGSGYNNYSSTSYFHTCRLNGVVYDGNTLVAGAWLPMLGVDAITKVETKVSAKKIHVGYRVKEDVPEAVKAGLKPEYTLDESGFHYGSDGEIEFSAEFSSLHSLYEPTYELSPEKWEEREFEAVCLGVYEVEDYQSPEKMKIKLHHENTSWGNAQIDEVDLSSVVCYSDIERILTPSFMLHKRPCFLEPVQVYKIIRAHIKENINPRSAEITSDYDFCFTVKRKIHHKPVTKSQEIKKNNGRSYATPKFKSTTVTYKTEELFEMAPKPYQNYTVVQDWKADSLEDMKEQIRLYLDMLMDEINKDVELCPCCNGVGSVVKKIPTNER